MSKRTDRQEAERLARKEAYLAARQQTTAAEPVIHLTEEPETEPIISEAQLAANRANAQFSTGATSPEGRAKSSMNALKHGLTSKTVLLPNENPADYQNLTNIFLEMFNPATDDESRLVQSIIDTDWRLLRITRLESALQYKGQLECIKQNEERQGIEREHFILAEAYLKYEKSLRNLQIQESRLRRLIEKTKAELHHLQSARKHQELQAIQAQLKAAKLAKSTPNQSTPQPQPSANGFVYSTAPNTQSAPHQPQAQSAQNS